MPAYPAVRRPDCPAAPYHCTNTIIQYKMSFVKGFIKKTTANLNHFLFGLLHNEYGRCLKCPNQKKEIHFFCGQCTEPFYLFRVKKAELLKKRVF